VRARAKSSPGKTETTISSTILALLMVVGLGIYWKQFRYDASIYTPDLPRDTRIPGSAPAAASPMEFVISLPAGLRPMGPAERFSAETLSDKINGKAELYLSAGFVALDTQRAAPSASPNDWLEVFLYDMGSAANAFSVFSSQRRSGARDLDLGLHAYATDNAVYLAHGAHYLEIVAASSKPELIEHLLTLARTFVADRPTAAGQMTEPTLFPEEGLDPTSITLLASDVFGFDRLDRVYLVSYRLDGKASLSAFVSRRSSPAEAADLAAAYGRFLLENGGKALPASLAIPEIQLIDLFGTTEIVFHHRGILAGIHEAEHRLPAEQLAERLFRHLVRTVP
jgi:hypothetical protein